MKRLVLVCVVLAWSASLAGAAQLVFSLARNALGQWQLYGQLSNNADNDGLSSLIVNVQASGGDLGVSSSTCTLPYGTHYWLEGGTQSQVVGFTEYRDDGAAGIGIRAGQKTTSLGQVVLTDVGYSSGSYPGDQTGGGLGPTTIDWSAPVLIAGGAYTGSYGTLTATAGAGQVNVLDEGRDPSQTGGVHQIESVASGQFRVLHPGDASGDNAVDSGDLALVTGSWQAGSGKTWGDGDFTFDGAVDSGDLAILTGSWQWSAPSPAPPAAIPEPASALLALPALALLAIRRRKAAR